MGKAVEKKTMGPLMRFTYTVVAVIVLATALGSMVMMIHATKTAQTYNILFQYFEMFVLIAILFAISVATAIPCVKLVWKSI